LSAIGSDGNACRSSDLLRGQLRGQLRSQLHGQLCRPRAGEGTVGMGFPTRFFFAVKTFWLFLLDIAT
jgi:hypothetical protein